MHDLIKLFNLLVHTLLKVILFLIFLNFLIKFFFLNYISTFHKQMKHFLYLIVFFIFSRTYFFTNWQLYRLFLRLFLKLIFSYFYFLFIYCINIFKNIWLNIIFNFLIRYNIYCCLFRFNNYSILINVLINYFLSKKVTLSFFK